MRFANVGGCRQLLVLLAVLHLGCATVFTLAPRAELQRFLSATWVYRCMTGLYRDYGYFAPAVASDVRAAALLARSDGLTTFVPFDAKGHETRLRINNLLGAALDQKGLRNTIVRSMAASLLGADRKVESAHVIFQRQVMPDMLSYRNGHRPAWRTVYVGRFDRRTTP